MRETSQSETELRHLFVIAGAIAEANPRRAAMMNYGLRPCRFAHPRHDDSLAMTYGIETPSTHGLLSTRSLQRARARRGRHRRARADQHRQDASGHRAPACAFLRHDRPAAAAARARGLQQDRRARRRRLGRADHRRGEDQAEERRASGSRPWKRCRATSTCRSSPSTRSRSRPISSAGTSSPTACCTGAAATRPCCWARPPCARSSSGCCRAPPSSRGRDCRGWNLPATARSRANQDGPRSSRSRRTKSTPSPS